MRRLQYETGTRFHSKDDETRDTFAEVYKLDHKNRLFEMVVKDNHGKTIYFFDIHENKIDEELIEVY